jgi:hypothetical protein
LDFSKKIWSRIAKRPSVEGRELGEGRGAFGSLDLKNRQEAPFPSRGVHYLADKMVQLICCMEGREML